MEKMNRSKVILVMAVASLLIALFTGTAFAKPKVDDIEFTASGQILVWDGTQFYCADPAKTILLCSHRTHVKKTFHLSTTAYF